MKPPSGASGVALPMIDRRTAAAPIVGLLDLLHIITDWSREIIPSFAPVWMCQYASLMATVVLGFATWHFIPHFVKAVFGMLRTILLIHLKVNYALVCSILLIVRLISSNVGSLELNLSMAAVNAKSALDQQLLAHSNADAGQGQGDEAAEIKDKS
jgi:hypothetical protein